MIDIIMAEALSNTYQLNEELKMLAVDTIHHKKLFFLLNPKKTSTQRFVDIVHENYNIDGVPSDDIKIVEKLSNECIIPSTNPVDRFCQNLINEFKITIEKTIPHNQYIKGISVERADEIKRDSNIRIFVTTLFQTIHVSVTSNCTIRELMILILHKLGDLTTINNDIDSQFFDNYRMIFSGKQIDNDDSLITSHNMTDNCTVHMCLRLRGGMFHETSGRAGNYQEIKSIFITIEPDLSP